MRRSRSRLVISGSDYGCKVKCASCAPQNRHVRSFAYQRTNHGSALTHLKMQRSIDCLTGLIQSFSGFKNRTNILLSVQILTTRAGRWMKAFHEIPPAIIKTRGAPLKSQNIAATPHELVNLGISSSGFEEEQQACW